MNTQESKALTKYAESLRELVSLRVPGAQEQSTAYEDLARLLKADSLEIFEPALFSTQQSQPDFPELERLLASAKDAFANRATKGELLDALEEFIHAASAEEIKSLPETEILLEAAKRWRINLEQEQEDPVLVLEKIASLDLEQIDEDFIGESARVDIPLFMENRGISAAISVILMIEVFEGNLKLSIDKAEQVSAKEWSLPITVRIQRNQRLGKRLSLAFQGAGKVRLCLQGKSSNRPSLTISSNPPLEMSLASNVGPSGSGTGTMENIANPYVPDEPLLKPRHWEKLAKGKHHGTLQEIKDDSKLVNGNVLVVRGCRRSGKTTVLRNLAAVLAIEEGSFLPVYIDLRSWFQEWKSNAGAITEEGLYYEFAVETYSNAIQLLKAMQGKETGDVESRLAESRSYLVGKDKVGLMSGTRTSLMLTAEEFFKFSTSIKKAVGRTILLIIDELDWWIHKSIFKGNVESIINELAASSAEDKPFSALISHDRTSTGWKLKTNRFLLPRHIRFLAESDIRELALEAPTNVEFTELAIDLIWRVSGGWPGLVQLVFYVAIEVLSQRSQGQIVDAGIVRKAVAIILETADYKNLVAYLLESLTRDELALLKALTRCVDLDSGEIRYLRFNSNLGYRIEGPSVISETEFDDSANLSLLMDSLKEKEIVEVTGSNSSKLRLRVGLLAYARSYHLSPE